MEPERWSRITDLFQEASELPEHARTELLARVSPDDRAEVESLLAHAADDTMDIVHDAVAAAARQLLPESARPAPPLSGGARLGRYVVLDWIGAGGMGVVYAAWDPQLDRKVAIKLLHGHEGDEDGLTSPLIGEARAMARLAHPNVLAIHDVGTLDGQVFVATEFVDGVTLRRWLQTPRTWREIRGVLLAAGQGLAAAHAAGIVHRDFKPKPSRLPPKAPLPRNAVDLQQSGLLRGRRSAQAWSEVVRMAQSWPKSEADLARGRGAARLRRIATPEERLGAHASLESGIPLTSR